GIHLTETKVEQWKRRLFDDMRSRVYSSVATPYSTNASVFNRLGVSARRIESGLFEAAPDHERVLVASTGVMNATLVEQNQLLRELLGQREAQNSVLH